MPHRSQSEELKEKARASLGRVISGLESRQAPVVGRIVQIIREISGQADRMSVNDLAEYVSGDPTTTSRIIALAGSLGYNSSGVEISSIHHAVSLIGFERVRNLAVSILLLQNAQSEGVAEINRDLAGLALVSGLTAAELGRRTPQVDPDLAFVCGALRNYGRMLASTFMPYEYVLTVRSVRRERDEAFRDRFGLSALELGRQVLMGLNLPKNILNSLVAPSEQALRRGSMNAAATLIVIVDFSLRLAEMIQAPELTLANFDGQREALSLPYDRLVHLTKDSTQELMASVTQKLDAFTFGGGFAVPSIPLFRRLDCLVLEHELPQTRLC